MGRVWDWLPDPVLDNTAQHYKPFEDLIGLQTDEKDRPSSNNKTLTAVAQEEQGCKNSLLVAQNARCTVKCTECQKPRCIYAKLKLTARDSRALNHTLEKYDYSCGSVITPDGDVLQGKVFVRLQLSCQSHVEFSYYATGIGRADICCYCCATEVDRSTDLLKTHGVVLPVCANCIKSGKDIPKRNPIKK